MTRANPRNWFRITALLCAFALVLAFAALSFGRSATTPAKPRPTYDELLAENESLKYQLAAVEREKDDWVLSYMREVGGRYGR